jgi:hypothetical protein
MGFATATNLFPDPTFFFLWVDPEPAPFFLRDPEPAPEKEKHGKTYLGLT